MSRYDIYLYVAPLKILMFFGCAIAFSNVKVFEFFGSAFDGWDRRVTEIQEVRLFVFAMQSFFQLLHISNLPRRRQSQCSVTTLKTHQPIKLRKAYKYRVPLYFGPHSCTFCAHICAMYSPNLPAKFRFKVSALHCQLILRFRSQLRS